MLIREAFLADKEYRQLFDDLKNALGARALPFVACGLCDGAADGLMAALFTSLGEKWEVGAAIICTGTYLSSEIFLICSSFFHFPVIAQFAFQFAELFIIFSAHPYSSHSSVTRANRAPTPRRTTTRERLHCPQSSNTTTYTIKLHPSARKPSTDATA